MKLEEAKQLKAGQTIYAIPNNSLFNNKGLNKDGTPYRYVVTSVKVWKTRPNSVLVKVKRGMYEYAHISEREISSFSLTEQIDSWRTK